jgi:carboxypeptidase D
LTLISSPSHSKPNLFESIPIVRVIETYPQLINYDTQMYDYLRDQNHVCNFDLNLTYPQTGGKLPYTPIKQGILDHRLPQSQSTRRHARSDGEDFLQEPHERWLAFLEEQRRSPEERELQRREWTRDTFSAAEAVIVDANSTSALSSKSSTKSVNSTTETSKLIAKATSTAAVNKFPGVPPFNKSLRSEINAFYGCDLLDAAMIYALNFTYPWSASLPPPDLT